MWPLRAAPGGLGALTQPRSPFSIVAERFLSELRSQVIGLFPNFGLDGQKIDEVARRNAQHSGRIAHPSLSCCQNVQHQAHGRPESGILASEVQSAVSFSRFLVIVALKEGFRRQGICRQFVSDLQIQGLSEPAQSPEAIFMLRAAFLSNYD